MNCRENTREVLRELSEAMRMLHMETIVVESHIAVQDHAHMHGEDMWLTTKFPDSLEIRFMLLVPHRMWV